MKTRTRCLVALCGILFSSGLMAAETMPKLESYQRVPEGWRTEVIPFPLAFAPEIKLQGKEELIFAPGMYTPGAEDFFSYLFAWDVTEAELNQQRMLEYLTGYYHGLYRAVAKKAPDSVVVSLNSSQMAGHYSGEISWNEPFVSHQPQVLGFDAYQLQCVNKGNSDLKEKSRWYFLVSPQPRTHEIWQKMRKIQPAPC